MLILSPKGTNWTFLSIGRQRKEYIQLYVHTDLVWSIYSNREHKNGWEQRGCKDRRVEESSAPLRSSSTSTDDPHSCKSWKWETISSSSLLFLRFSSHRYVFENSLLLVTQDNTKGETTDPSQKFLTFPSTLSHPGNTEVLLKLHTHRKFDADSRTH